MVQQRRDHRVHRQRQGLPGLRPSGSTWTVSGTSISSTLNGQNYFSVAVLPTTPSTPAATRTSLASTYGQYAHAHVTGTRVSYSYNPGNSNVSTTYTFTTTAREGSASGTVIALYPHQWNYLTGSTPLAQTYISARGQMKVVTGTSFSTTMKFQGVLPEIPAVGDSSGGDLTTITNYLNAELGDPTAGLGDDTYWTGKGLGRAARIAEIADQLNLTSVRDSALNRIRTRLNDWFTASSGKTSRVFYYNQPWGTCSATRPPTARTSNSTTTTSTTATTSRPRRPWPSSTRPGRPTPSTAAWSTC